MTIQQAAEIGRLVEYAMDMYVGDPASLAPPADPRLSPEWRLVGYLTATDSVAKIASQTVCYGYLAQLVSEPTTFVVAIRGTDGPIEWFEDAEYSQVPHPVAGKVEAGFWGIYASMQYRPIDGGSLPAAQGLAAAIGAGTVTVLGHSLGSALATYLTFDLAGIFGPRVSGCFFASPRPGDDAFAKAFDARVQAYQVWNFWLDVVPRLPMGSDYCGLPRITIINVGMAQAQIRLNVGCWHHIVCYLANMDFRLLDWQKVPLCDQSNAACIKGPSAVTG